jgi:hypothetical protein
MSEATQLGRADGVVELDGARRELPPSNALGGGGASG